MLLEAVLWKGEMHKSAAAEQICDMGNGIILAVLYVLLLASRCCEFFYLVGLITG